MISEQQHLRASEDDTPRSPLAGLGPLANVQCYILPNKQTGLGYLERGNLLRRIQVVRDLSWAGIWTSEATDVKSENRCGHAPFGATNFDRDCFRECFVYISMPGP